MEKVLKKLITADGIADGQYINPFPQPLHHTQLTTTRFGYNNAKTPGNCFFPLKPKTQRTF